MSKCAIIGAVSLAALHPSSCLDRLGLRSCDATAASCARAERDAAARGLLGPADAPYATADEVAAAYSTLPWLGAGARCRYLPAYTVARRLVASLDRPHLGISPELLRLSVVQSMRARLSTGATDPQTRLGLVQLVDALDRAGLKRAPEGWGPRIRAWRAGWGPTSAEVEDWRRMMSAWLET